MRQLPFIFLLLIATLFSGHGQQIIRITDDFESGSSRWLPSSPELWRVGRESGNSLYQLIKAPEIPTDIRRPGALSILRDRQFTDVSISLDMRCDEDQLSQGRDLIVVVGYQDPLHYYYVHLSNHVDPHHNNILIVNGKDRAPLESSYRVARLTDRKFHRVRVYRQVASGIIAAYVDDMEFPVLVAVDKTLQWGTVGIGSFNDWGSFDNVQVSGVTR